MPFDENDTYTPNKIRTHKIYNIQRVDRRDDEYLDPDVIAHLTNAEIDYVLNRYSNHPATVRFTLAALYLLYGFLLGFAFTILIYL